MTFEIYTDIALTDGLPHDPVFCFKIFDGEKLQTFTGLLKDKNLYQKTHLAEMTSLLMGIQTVLYNYAQKGDRIIGYTDSISALGGFKPLHKLIQDTYNDISIVIESIQLQDSDRHLRYLKCHAGAKVRRQLKFGNHKNKKLENKQRIFHQVTGQEREQTMWYN